MLIFKELSLERKKEIINYIVKNENESARDIAFRFNISKAKVNILKRKYINKKTLSPF
ncbi:hypothetical protein J7J47_02985 [Halomonas sp. ISL-60]|nr:hypothetical protein [Halomonas sp. ISL-60]